MLTDYPVVVDIVVRWGDMDSLGHVNNILYLQYFETARIDYLMRLGMDPPGPSWQESGLIIKSVTCRFVAPVKFPDTLSVGARVASIGDDRLIMEHAAYSQRMGSLAAEGDAVIVSYDYVNCRRRPLSTDTLGAINALEGRELPRLTKPGRTTQPH
ncbi:MAG: acyl-CoA thioesterase [Actinobacteria bacterium]|nr:acyl-CoA thioesterase [Actinomycetota bacterium]